jgi:hypothetical protein
MSKSSGNGLLSTGRLATLAVILVVGGVEAPRLRSLAQSTPGSGPVSGRFAQVENTAKTITTKQRMNCVKAALKLWSAQHGVPSEGDVGAIVGKGTSLDGWGHPIHLTLPTEDSDGILRSLGPDGVRSADDITVPVRWNDVHKQQIAPAWD